MKTCPVCSAVAFDDAQTCYGCLHRFDDPAPAAVLFPKDVGVEESPYVGDAPEEAEPMGAPPTSPPAAVSFSVPAPQEDARGWEVTLAWRADPRVPGAGEPGRVMPGSLREPVALSVSLRPCAAREDDEPRREPDSGQDPE